MILWNKKSSKSRLESVSVLGCGTLQWQVVARFGSCCAESVFSRFIFKGSISSRALHEPKISSPARKEFGPTRKKFGPARYTAEKRPVPA